MGSKLEKFLEASNASEITSALKECGDGDMKNGVIILTEESHDRGVGEGRTEGIIWTTIIGGGVYLIGSGIGKLVEWFDERKVRKEKENELAKKIEKGIEDAKKTESEKEITVDEGNKTKEV